MRLSLLVSVLTLFALPAVSLAHPETGFLPDAIAEMEYKMVLDLNPTDLRTRNKLGIVLYRKNRLKEAQLQFGQVLKAAPKDFDAHDGMGLVKIKERSYADAVAWFAKAISLNGADTMVHYNQGFAYEQLGRLAEAEVCYRQGLAVNGILLQKGINRDAELGKRSILLAALKSVQAKLNPGRGRK